jgi:hypothetical protein
MPAVLDHELAMERLSRARAGSATDSLHPLSSLRCRMSTVARKFELDRSYGRLPLMLQGASHARRRGA